MKFYVATLATTLLVCLTGSLNAQAPCNYGPQQTPYNCGQCGQCGQSSQVYLVLTPIHRSCEPSSHWLIGGKLFHAHRSNDDCGCGESQCGQSRCGEPCHAQPCYAQAPCNEGRCNEGRCNEGRCNEGRCNEGRCGGHPWSMSFPVKVVSCAPACQYPAPANCGQPYGQAYGPRGGMAAGPATTAEPPQAEGNAYIPLIQAIQAAQEKDNRAMREMMENRQATLSLVRAIQSSDAQTVSSFEKMLQQMKDGASAKDNGK
jgi:hypothetical protein